MLELLKSRLSPFRQRHFRNFFFAQTLSMVGTFSHELARSWIIVDTIGKSGALGNIQMAVAVPCLMFILHGGAYVDRTNVRRLMMYTKSVLGLAATILALITEYSSLQYWHLLVYGIIEGSIVAFDSPAFSALVVRMVPKEDFRQAIALNSTNFHMARMLGPVIAALLMSWHGPSIVFLFDGITYLLIAFVISRVDVSQFAIAKTEVAKGWSGVREGLSYIFKTPRLRYRMTQLFITIGFALPIVTSVFRVYIQQKFNLTAAEFGSVFMFPAFGSMAGAFTFTAFQPKDPLRALIMSIPGSVITLLALPYMGTLPLATACMTGTGFFLYLSFASLTVSMQLEVEERFRGRLSSVIQLGFVGVGPAMSAPWGHLADIVGPPMAIYLCAGGFFVSSALQAFLHHRALARKQKYA